MAGGRGRRRAGDGAAGRPGHARRPAAAGLRRSRGFVYGVNLMGVTGERSDARRASAVLAKRIKAVTDLPVIMGFGISTPSTGASVGRRTPTGSIVASAIMRILLDGGTPATPARSSPTSAPPSTRAESDGVTPARAAPG